MNKKEMLSPIVSKWHTLLGLSLYDKFEVLLWSYKYGNE